MEILLDNQVGTELKERYKDIIDRVVAEVLEQEGFSGKGEVSVSIVDNEKIKNMNQKYRGINQATDVLSFPLYDGLYLLGIEKKSNIAIGDIVISLEKAFAQAEEYGHSVEREVGFLTAHGMLHLLGYDHMVDEDEEIMFGKQENVLSRIGLGRE